MKLERKLLLSALKTAEPALADKTPLTQLLCFWFSGEALFAYNDVIGINVPFKTDFQGGVQGKTLVGLVINSKAKQAEVTVEGNGLCLKLASCKATLPTIPYDQAVWELPAKPKNGIKLDETLLAAFKHVLLSAADEIGISLVGQDGMLELYSSNDRTLSWSVAPSKKVNELRVEIPPAFCGQLLDICEEGGELFIESDFVMAVANNGAAVFSRIIHSEKPLDYAEALGVALPEGYEKQLVDTPARLALAVDRALVLTNGDILPVKHTITDGVLNLALDSNLGQLREQVPLGIKYKIDSQFDVALIKKGLSKTDSIMFTNSCAIMCAGANSGYVVSCLVA